MLKAKHLGNFSQSARSFFLSGSRCNAADGSSCTCCDDETCTSRKQQIKNYVRHVQEPSDIVPKTSILVGSEKANFPIPLPKVVSATSVSEKPNRVIYAHSIDVAQEEMVPSPITDQIVRVGFAAASFLSDVVNYKIPTSNGSAMQSSGKNYMVDPTRPLSSIKSSNVKTFRKETVRVTAAEAVVVPKPPKHSYVAKGRGEKSGADKSFNRIPKNVSGKSLETCTRSSGSYESKRVMPPRPNAYSNCYMPNVRYSEGKKFQSAEGFNKSARDMKFSKEVGVVGRQFASTGHVVERVSRILQELKWGPVTEEALGKANCSMDPYQANQILKQLQDHSVALGFFYWLKRQAGFKHDGHTYTTMVGILGRSRQFGAIKKLLDQMIQDGCQPNVVTYNRLIHSYGRANYLSEAVEVFNQMQKLGVEPDRVTYCTLIDIHAKSGFLDFAMDMYQRMQRAGLSPDTFTYSVIINCLGKAGHLTAAHKLFCEMVDQGCVPNLVTYNIMIALQAKARNYPSSLQLYRDMQSAGYEPDKVTYSIIMEVLGHCGYLEEAEAVFSEMKLKKFVPDEPVYGLLVDLWGKAGNAGKAWGWYQTMLDAGLRPNVPTCNSLLSAFLRVHQLEDAYNLLQSMLNLGLHPSLQTYTLLLSCCTDAQTSFDMGFCCELMAVTGHPAHRFLQSMPAAGPDGQNVRSHVSNFLDLMHSEDRESKRGLVDAVVDFLHKTGLKEEAGSVWEVAALKNVYPDSVREKSSCYWLINLHVMSDGTAVTALSRTLAWFRRRMLASGVRPSRIDIVTGWGRRSRVTGTSLVRQSVQDLLHIFDSPFFTENGNSGCFVGCGEALNRWLLQSCVERMHLL